LDLYEPCCTHCQSFHIQAYSFDLVAAGSSASAKPLHTSWLSGSHPEATMPPAANTSRSKKIPLGQNNASTIALS